MKRLKNFAELVIGVGGCLGALALMIWVGFSLSKGAVDTYRYWGEPEYVVSRAYDPLYSMIARNGGDISGVVCNSPARCEPNGCGTNWQYFMVVGEHEMKELGLSTNGMVKFDNAMERACQNRVEAYWEAKRAERLRG